MPYKVRPIIYSAVILIGAGWILRHLYTGGWLSHRYQLDDPNVVNLFLAIIEAVVVVVVAAYWIWRTRAVYRLLFASFIVQLMVIVAFAAVILFFVATWKPKLM